VCFAPKVRVERPQKALIAGVRERSKGELRGAKRGRKIAANNAAETSRTRAPNIAKRKKKKARRDSRA